VDADQHQVWEEIAARQQRGGFRSQTGAVNDTFAHHEPDLADAERSLPYPEDNPVGVVALVGGRSFCADVFDHPETLRAYWPRLVRSYALEALESAPGTPSLDSALRLLQRLSGSRRTVYPSPGLGHDVRIDGNGVVGAALVHHGAVVHTALFRIRGGTGPEPSIHRPSDRLRRYIRE
jgi:hypothetical protein